ncbi:MFS transporter [Halorhabdus sp. CBA1104]|uniref:MFS transporter n=1 Tax=unclassified Halorhabdus TaxID=2621901 RepID=UPI0012B31A75|nr:MULTISPECIES: MFS transporter [unclassified Halorhabdus]QGN07521.1 MFS transporter [Halorhabdus sp. CBA1104]
MVLLVNLGRVVFAPLLDPLRQQFGTSAAAVGLLATLAWLGSALSRLPTGYLLTRYPRQQVILGTGLLLTVAAVVAATALDVWMLMLGAFLLGLSSGTYFIAANPLVSELFPDRVGLALGLHGTASQVAAVGAPLLVTATLALGRWRRTFQLLAILAVLATIAFYLAARRNELPAAGSEDRDLSAAVVHQWRIVLVGVVVVGFAGFVWQGLFNFYVTFLKTLEYSGATARLLLTVVFAAGLPAFAFTGWLADHVSPLRLLVAIFAAFGVSVFALTLPLGPAWLIGTSVLMGYVIHSLFPVADTYLLGSLPDRHRASAYSAYSATMMMVQAAGSWVVGLLRDAAIPFPVIYRAFAIGLVACAVALFGLYRLGKLPAVARA